LASFTKGPATPSQSQLLTIISYAPLLSAVNAELQYAGEAQVEGRMQEVECWRKNHFLQIDVQGSPICVVNLNEQHIHVLNENSFDNQLNLEVVIGPALILLLALKGTYCLHAGAIATPYGNIGLIAESGLGKSTLSSHIDSNWQQISDDILPLFYKEERFRLGEFPQLKLAESRCLTKMRQGSSLDLIFRLTDKESSEIHFVPLRRTDALLQIVRHTVAARLFDNNMMKQHAKFAKRLSGVAPVIELSYPRQIDQLDILRDQIVDYLKTYKKQ